MRAEIVLVATECSRDAAIASRPGITRVTLAT
jgi:hypothetical protein